MKKINLCFVFSFILLFSFLGISFANVYDYPDSLENISKKIPKMESIKCKFRQEKTMPNTLKPLVSSGYFEFIKDKGVYFHTTYPIKSEVNYTNKNYKQINEVINAVSAKKYSKLEKEFSFFYETSSNFWTLGMKPKKDSNAFDYISSITLEGSSYIQKISLTQTNGNKTTIWFTK